ncbi:hypothetical protein TNCV_1974951 [Trichonephila clavipes]|nr:hypothetical protein TNCV_1974951 [Trichonephila clavipes]
MHTKINIFVEHRCQLDWRLGGWQHLEKVRSSPYPEEVCPPLIYCDLRECEQVRFGPVCYNQVLENPQDDYSIHE